MSKTLYNITAEILYLLESVEDENNIPEDIMTKLQQLAIDHKEKLINCGFYVKKLKDDISAIAGEEKRLKKLKATNNLSLTFWVLSLKKID